MSCVRIVIASRKPLISHSLANLLQAESNFEVIASCITIPECIRLIQTESPDIAIIEHLMSSKVPSHDILAAVASACYFTRVVFLAASSEPADTSVNTVHELALKGSILAQCLAQITNGHGSANSVARQKCVSPHQVHPARTAPSGQPLAYLTEREREIVYEISEGISNKEAARRLNISEGTIKLHLHHIYHKLSIRNRAELVAMAVTYSAPAWLVV